MAKSKDKHCVNTVDELDYLDELYQDIPKKARKIVSNQEEIDYLRLLYSEPAT
jgi:hypothetical protein